MFQAIMGVPRRVVAPRHAHFVFTFAMAVAAMGALCEPAPKDISRDRAIQIAREQVSFNPDSVDAVQAVSQGPAHQTVWRVTVKGRLPGQPPELFETRIFEIDVRTGEIVSASMN